MQMIIFCESYHNCVALLASVWGNVFAAVLEAVRKRLSNKAVKNITAVLISQSQVDPGCFHGCQRHFWSRN